LSTEKLYSGIFRGSSLARPILGTRASLGKLTGEALASYMAERYRAGAVVIALSGSFTAGDIDRLRDRFSRLPPGGAEPYKPAEYIPALAQKRKAIEQNHVTIALPGISITDRRRHAMQLLSDILGGGMSSRLFQKVREERGLCYSIYTYGSSYEDTGIFAIYTALTPRAQEDAARLIAEELRRFREGGVTADELTRAREQVKANVLMSLESTSARMSRLGRNELYFGAVADTDEIIAKYDAVTPQDIAALSEYCLDLDRASLSVVGKTDGAQTALDILRG
jgi:predicted Zn-dependent peptidase